MAVDCDGKIFFNQGVKKHPITKQLMKLFTTDRTSHAVVRKEGKIPADPDMQKATSHFHRNVNDKVTGDALTIYVDIKASLKPEVMHGKEAASSQHGTKYASIRKHTIATVKMTLPNLMKQLGYSNNSLTDNKNAD